jgi:hypothetical protein
MMSASDYAKIDREIEESLGEETKRELSDNSDRTS